MGMLNFNARTVQPYVSNEPVPDGWYKVVIAKSNIKPTASGKSGLLELVLQIIEGQFQNRQIYYNLNVFNESMQASEIAYKQLSAISHVINVYDLQDQDVKDTTVPMIHNIPFMVHAVIAQGTNGPINNIRGVKDINGNDPGKSGGQPMNQAPQQGAWQGGGQPQGGPGPGWQGNASPQGGGAPSSGPSWSSGAPQQPGGQPPQNAPSGGPNWQSGEQQQQPQQNTAPPPNQPPQQNGAWQGGGQAQPQQPGGQPQGGQWSPGNAPANPPWQR